MKRNLLHFEFPKGVQSFCVNGVSYTRESFLLAQKKRTCYNKIHKLTHQTLQVCFIKEDVRKSKVDLSDFRPYNLSQIENIPLSALHQKYIDDNLGFLN